MDIKRLMEKKFLRSLISITSKVVFGKEVSWSPEFTFIVRGISHTFSNRNMCVEELGERPRISQIINNHIQFKTRKIPNSIPQCSTHSKAATIIIFCLWENKWEWVSEWMSQSRWPNLLCNRIEFASKLHLAFLFTSEYRRFNISIEWWTEDCVSTS